MIDFEDSFVGQHMHVFWHNLGLINTIMIYDSAKQSQWEHSVYLSHNKAKVLNNWQRLSKDFNFYNHFQTLKFYFPVFN